MSLSYVKGDATHPQGGGPKIITHSCNDLGRWGSGFTGKLSKRWPDLGNIFMAWYRRKKLEAGETSGPMGLGEVQLIPVEEDLWVANIIGQHGVGMGVGGRAPIRYDALRSGLIHVYRYAIIHEASVHMPKMGVGQAGGHWGNIEHMIKALMAHRGVRVVVYEQ